MKNIFIPGDWVKVNGKWNQVQDTKGNSVVIFTKLGTRGLLWGTQVVDITSIEMLRSDSEMQKILKQVGL